MVITIEGTIYKGDFKNVVFNGFGEIEYSIGGKYLGEWKNGKRDGYGIVVFPDDGSTYEGEWKEGLPHGKGIITTIDKKKQEVQFIKGELVK